MDVMRSQAATRSASKRRDRMKSSRSPGARCRREASTEIQKRLATRIGALLASGLHKHVEAAPTT